MKFELPNTKQVFSWRKLKNLLAPAESSREPSISSSLFLWMQSRRRGQGLSHRSFTACICACCGTQRTSASGTAHTVSHKHCVRLIIYLTVYNGRPGRSPLEVEGWLQYVRSYLLQDQQKYSPPMICVQFHSSFSVP